MVGKHPEHNPLSLSVEKNSLHDLHNLDLLFGHFTRSSKP
eukprot:UN20834